MGGSRRIVILDNSDFSCEGGATLMQFNQTELVLALMYTSAFLFAVIVLFLALPTLYKGPLKQSEVAK